MPRLIQLFEHETMLVGRPYPPDQAVFEDRDLRRLQIFHQQTELNYFHLLHRGVRFRHYVGVLQFEDLTIEILPKADRASSDPLRWQSFLIRMLRRVYDLPLNSPDRASVRQSHHPVVELFFESFLHEMEILIRQGLVRQYVRREQTTGALSGHLLIHRQVREHVIHKERFAVERATYQKEHTINQILYSTIRRIRQFASHPILRERSSQMGLNFEDWVDRKWQEGDFDRLRYNRRTERYRRAIELARYILLSIHPDVRSGGTPMLALLFDMNVLWEKYVVSELRRQLPHGWRVREQSPRKFWESDSSSAWLKPDILITSPEGRTVVWDTKWKIPRDSKPSEEDLRQIYVYLDYYGSKDGFLVYPATGETTIISGSYTHPGEQSNAGILMLSCDGEIIGLPSVLTGQGSTESKVNFR